VLVLSGMVMLDPSRANASLDYTDNSSQDSISLSVNRSSSSTHHRQRSTPSQPSSPSTIRSGVGDNNVSGSINRSGAENDAPSPRCRNRSEIFSAMTQGRECDPSIPPFAMTVPNEPDAEPVANQPEV